jgi:acyl-CoA synthetase (AMP-forming)/AMP-acid ligase II
MNSADYMLELGNDHHIALITDKGEYTYLDLKIAVNRVAHALLAAKVQPHDRIALLDENSLFWVAAYLAIMKIGAVAVLFPTTFLPEEIEKMERFIKCRAVCVKKRFSRKFSDALANIPQQILDDVVTPTDDSPQPEKINAVPVDPDDDAVFNLTSGTTADPRVVRVSHRNIQANSESIIEYLKLTPADRIMVILPFFYCFGASLLHTHLRVGGSAVLCNTFAYPETVLDRIEETQATGFAGVPSTYQILLRNSSFPERNLSSLTKIQQAGGKLQPVLIKELMTTLPQAQINVMYGQTEATARLSYLPPDLLETKLGSIGKGIPGVELTVVNDSGNPVKPGEVGEILAQGDNICLGYLDNPEATARKFVNGTLYTGDLATIDEDGFIYVVDRKSDFIKSFGHRISSQQIESYILELPEIVNAAAIGVPEPTKGEAIKVFVVVRQNSRITPDDIMTFCQQRMQRYMVPTEIVIVDSLPMNRHGKIIKSVLKEQIEKVS